VRLRRNSFLSVAAAAAVLVAAGRFAAYESHVVNIRAHVVSPPCEEPAVAGIEDEAILQDEPFLEEQPAEAGMLQNSNGVTAACDYLEINTEIDFGIVFPGQTITEDFIVCLSTYGYFHSYSYQIVYTLELKLKPLPGHPGEFYPDIRPYIAVIRDPTEPDWEYDPDAGGEQAGIVPADYDAKGKVSKHDRCDRWLVTVWVPHFPREYNEFTDPQHGSHGFLPEEADSNGWWLGGDVRVRAYGIQVIEGAGGGD